VPGCPTHVLNPAVRKFVPPGDGFHLAKGLAALHAPIIEHFCSIRNVATPAGEEGDVGTDRLLEQPRAGSKAAAGCRLSKQHADCRFSVFASVS